MILQSILEKGSFNPPSVAPKDQEFPLHFCCLELQAFIKYFVADSITKQNVQFYVPFFQYKEGFI